MKRRRAFSLLELIIALAMVAVLSLSLYRAMSGALRARKNVLAMTETNRAASIAADVVREDFESVPRPNGVYAGPFVAYHQPASEGDQDTIQFCAIGEDQPMSDSPLAEGIRRIELLVNKDVSPPVLLRRVTRNLAPSLEAKVEEEILCRDVRSFSLRYFDGFTWQETWDSTTVENGLPLAVSIVVDVGDPQHPTDPPIRATRIITLSCAKPVETSALGGWVMQRRGTILIITMIISFALAGTVLVLCRSMRVETMASANLAASLQASSVERGAEQYVIAMLTEQPNDINNIAEDQFEAVPVGEGFFWILRPDYDDPNQPVYGIIDENAKININSASFEALSRLPGMTYTAASSIMDWKDEDSNLERDGAESEYYLTQPEPYYCKDSPFETVEELLQVRGVDRLMLYGDGTAPPLGQRSSIFSSGNGMTDPQIARGLYDLITVYSAENNRTADGQSRINVNVSRSDRPRMRLQLQQRLGQRLDTKRAAQIVALVGDNRLHDIYEMYFRCKLTTDELDQIADDITSSTGTVIRGRININTASRSVLETLTTLDDEDIDKLISARSGTSTGYAWVADAIKEKSINLGPLITNRSYQYSADILATSGNGRAFKRVRIVVDTRSGTPQIIYRRELTQRGWPMEPQILASLRSGQFAGNTRGMTMMGAAQ